MATSFGHLSRDELEDLAADQALVIAQLTARLSKARGDTPRKSSKNSHQPPSSDRKGTTKGARSSKEKKPRPPRPGVSRRLSSSPDAVVTVRAKRCPRCTADVSGARQAVRRRYDHIDLPSVRPVVTRVELLGGRCGFCGSRYCADAPADMPLGTPFGPSIQAMMFYLHHAHHIGYERLSRLASELWGLNISEGAIGNLFARGGRALEDAKARIKETIRRSPVISSDETTARIDGVTHWHWTFVTEEAVFHDMAPRRAKAVAEQVLGDHRPEVWISDRYAGQQDLADAHQVCLAHVLRDVQYAIDEGDPTFASKLRDLLRWAIRVGRRRDDLKDATLRQYHDRADRKLDALLAIESPHPEGRKLQKSVKTWWGKFFLFLQDRRVPATNNACEREIRPSVVKRKVAGGFRTPWGADAHAHAAYRSLTSTARLHGHSDYRAISEFITAAYRGQRWNWA